MKTDHLFATLQMPNKTPSTDIFRSLADGIRHALRFVYILLLAL